MTLDVLERLPRDATGAVCVLSGGMDSTIATRLCVERYGRDRVAAVTFMYGQRQIAEIECARRVAARLRIHHEMFDLRFLGELGRGFSANCDDSIPMPTIRDVLGDPRPITYVPNRNMILLSLAAALAEVRGYNLIVAGFQMHDEYGYHDTTARFVEKITSVLAENRKFKIQIVAPFSELSKVEEIRILRDLDNSLDLLADTLTCYAPTPDGRHCGNCPSCAERARAFAVAGERDPAREN